MKQHILDAWLAAKRVLMLDLYKLVVEDLGSFTPSELRHEKG